MGKILAGRVEDVAALANAYVEECVASSRAYVDNALFHLDVLRSTIHDGLSGKNDLMLKVSLLYDLDEAERNLRKALA